MRLTIPIGTRPEIIKLAPVVSALRRSGHQVRCVASGQHADPRLAADIFAELGCRPDAVWDLPTGEGQRAGALLAAAFGELVEHRPDALTVLGDTYTAVLLAFAARRFGIGVVHLEAGLRSFNDMSMEETNRRMLTALATVHLAPTELAARFLRAEGVPESRVRVVGNPVIDALAAQLVDRVALPQRRGVLLTAHRANNVDDPQRLGLLVRIVRSLSESFAPVVFPVHPRTRARLQEHGYLSALAGAPGLQLTEPLPYRELLRAVAAARIVVTDSGGLQEEASYLGVPCVVLRNSTPRWEGVLIGAARVCGLDPARALEAAHQMAEPSVLAHVAELPCPYGDGHAAERIVAALADPELVTELVPREHPAGLPAEVLAQLADA